VGLRFGSERKSTAKIPCWCVRQEARAPAAPPPPAVARPLRCFWPANVSTMAFEQAFREAEPRCGQVTEFAVAYAALWMAAELAVIAMRR
jgi:hypothetical protein